MAKVDVASTAAAMLGVTQAAAAAMGVLAVWTTAEGLIDIPLLEQVGVGIVTVLVALALGLGCALTLTGQSPRILALGFVGSLMISAYWLLLRPPAEEFPVIPVVYAVLPVLGMALLAVSAARSRSHTAPPDAAENADEVESQLAAAPPGQPGSDPAELPDQAGERPDWA